MDKKLKDFKELVFDAFEELEQFDKVEFNLLRIRDVLINRHKFIDKLSAYKQFELCVTVSTIAIDTMRQHLNENMPLSKPDKSKKFPFSQDWGFKKPNVLSIGKELTIKQVDQSKTL